MLPPQKILAYACAHKLHFRNQLVKSDSTTTTTLEEIIEIDSSVYGYISPQRQETIWKLLLLKQK